MFLRVRQPVQGRSVLVLLLLIMLWYKLKAKALVFAITLIRLVNILPVQDQKIVFWQALRVQLLFQLLRRKVLLFAQRFVELDIAKNDKKEVGNEYFAGKENLA